MAYLKLRLKKFLNFAFLYLTCRVLCDILIKCLNLGVAQLVARYLGVVEAASSSLVTQTSIKTEYFCTPFFAFLHDTCVFCRETLQVTQT